MKNNQTINKSHSSEQMKAQTDEIIMTTREKIIHYALELFAEKGYDGVSVRQIAGAVGVRESALYKHFKNKEDILQKVIEEVRKRISEAYIVNQVPEKISDDVAGGYRKLTGDQVCEIAWNLFCFYTKDPEVSNFRKLLMREQYGDSAISALYNQFFLEGAVARQRETFAALMEDGFFRKEDPEIIALHFYAPILYLFQRYDCEPDKEEEIRKMLYDHVKAFGKNYANVQQ